jgi:hypothetical protein
MLALNTPLVTVELLAACIWVGSLVCLALVTSTARRVLDAPSQVAFFRAIGRRYGIVGTGALLVAIGAGLALSWPPSTWSSTIDAAVALRSSRARHRRRHGPGPGDDETPSSIGQLTGRPGRR